MKILRNIRIAWASAAILLLINTVLVTLLWLGRPPHPRHDRPDAEQAAMRFKRDLGLDEAQTNTLKQSIKVHFEQIEKVQKDRNGNVEACLMHVGKLDAHDPQVLQLMEKVGDLNRKMLELQFEHFTEINALCRSDQKGKFEEMLPKIIHGSRRGPDRPGH